jgi:hypothetical protein
MRAIDVLTKPESEAGVEIAAAADVEHRSEGQQERDAADPQARAC